MTLLLAAGLLAGCSDTNTPEQRNEIVVQTDVRPMTQRIPARRAITYGSNAELQAEDLRIDAYFLNTASKYLDGAKLHYDASAWKFWTAGEPGEQVHYYWPVEGSVYDPASANITVSSLDFVGYCPFATPAYIEDLTYNTANHDVSFTCAALPMTSAGQASLKEFMFGMALDKNKTNAASGVNLSFVHPFARIKFLLSSASVANGVTIDSIAITGIKNNGSFSYTHSTGISAWTPSGSTTNLIVSASPATGEDYYLLVPQTFAEPLTVTVRANWNDWGDTPVAHILSTTIAPDSWQVGYSYTYTFHVTAEDLTVNITNFTEQW